MVCRDGGVAGVREPCSYGDIFSVSQGAFNVVFHALVVALVDSGIHGHHIPGAAVAVQIPAHNVASLVSGAAVLAAGLKRGVWGAGVFRGALRGVPAVYDTAEAVCFVDGAVEDIGDLRHKLTVLKVWDAVVIPADV